MTAGLSRMCVSQEAPASRSTPTDACSGPATEQVPGYVKKKGDGGSGVSSSADGEGVEAVPYSCGRGSNRTHV